jgi:class 3 adenylate cyclase
MLRIALGQAEGTHTDTVVAHIVEQCAAQLGGARPQVGLLSVSGRFDEQRILDLLAERFPGLGLVGCTSRGDVSSIAGFSEDGINLLLLQSDVLSLSVGLGRGSAQDPDAAAWQALTQARSNLHQPERLCLALPDNLTGQASSIVAALGRLLAPQCALFGGAAAVPWESETSRQFFGRQVLTDCLPLILIGGPIEYAHVIENGWRPVGERQRVTSAQGRVVHRIGDRTALACYQHYLGEGSLPLPEFPLALFGSDGRYVLRVPRSYDSRTGEITYSDPIPEGAIVQLTEAVRLQMLEQTETLVPRLAKGLTESQPELALVFSCSARRRILGSEIGRELQAVSESLPGIPVFGFQARGEIAPSAGGQTSLLHNSTLVALVLGIRGKEARVSETASTGARWQPPPTVALREEGEDPDVLSRKLSRSEFFRVQLEERYELNNALLRSINTEIERSRQRIAEQNEELRRLNDEIANEKRKTEELLLNILPGGVADELKRTGMVEPVFYESVTVLFTDFKGFTHIASTMSPKQLLDELDYYFSAFDAIIERHGLEKLKTIGDAYMCAGGLPTPFEGNALAVAQAAWEMQDFMAKDHAVRKAAGRTAWALRIGINTGALMAGVIGKKKFAYDIWGDTVNIASRLESNGEADRINISRTTHEAIRDHFICEYRGKFPVKNAGEIDMYFVVRPKGAMAPAAPQT